MNNCYNRTCNNERLWLPFLAGAAIISAPFWLGLSKNNNNNCCYPQYYPQPVYPQPYYPPYQQYPTYSNNYNYYI